MSFSLQTCMRLPVRYNNLWLFLLNQLKDFVGQLVVFGTGVREDVDEGSWQGDLQGDLNGADAHLWTVAAPLGHTERGENVHLQALWVFLFTNPQWNVTISHEAACLVIFSQSSRLLENLQSPAAFQHAHTLMCVTCELSTTQGYEASTPEQHLEWGDLWFWGQGGRKVTRQESPVSPERPPPKTHSLIPSLPSTLMSVISPSCTFVHVPPPIYGSHVKCFPFEIQRS